MVQRIHIEGLEILTHVGVSSKERSRAQRLVVNLTLWPRSRNSRDELARTIDYAAITDSIRQFTRTFECKLIETLAEQIATKVLSHFRAAKVLVEVRKFALPRTDYVSVTAVRSRRR